MMTLDEIRNIEFNKGRGYRADEVDDFIDECVAAMEALVQENRETNQKMKVLADKLAEYRNDEDSIRGALLNAQRTGDAILRDAQAKADALTGEAQRSAEALRQELLADLEAEREELARAKQEVAEFKNKIFGLYKEHLALLKLLPEEPAEAPAETPVESAQPVTEEPAEQPEDEDADADMIVVAPTTEETVRTQAEEELKPLSRFDDLKFGNDYDIHDEDDEDDEKPRGLFRKKK